VRGADALYNGRVTLTQLRTPCVLVDRRRMERNLDRMQAAANARGLRLRPHAKTHKSIDLARRQVAGGAVGICCAKLGEAEVFAEAGVEDIRLPYPLNPVNAERVVDLLERTRLSFIIDHPAVARGWSAAMQREGSEVDVLVKVDVGFRRCGIDPAHEHAVRFVEEIAALPGLRLRGILSHAGHAYGAATEAELRSIAEAEAQLMTELAASIRERGVEVEEVSVGATPPVRFTLEQDGITEVRPGNYIYFDRTQVALGAAAWDDCALTVLARVVSRPAVDRIILDSGSKTLTNDLARGFAPAPGYGAVLESIDGEQKPDRRLVIERLSEEHANVRISGGSHPLEPGDLVRIVPNHSCVVSNLVDSAWIVDGDQVVERLEISARGRIT
jgi:D-serine deaminase-like pyridoxal phosphate-dependent protein